MIFYCLILYQVQGRNHYSPMDDIWQSFLPLTRALVSAREPEKLQWNNVNMLARNGNLKGYMEKWRPDRIESII